MTTPSKRGCYVTTPSKRGCYVTTPSKRGCYVTTPLKKGRIIYKFPGRFLILQLDQPLKGRLSLTFSESELPATPPMTEEMQEYTPTETGIM